MDCSAKTVRRRLDEAGLHGRVAKKEYVLEEDDISSRLSFADGYANWTVDDWSHVIFSGETHIEVYGRDRVWVQRPVGKAYEPEYISQHMPHSERVSLWGCFCARGIGQAEIFVGKFDGPSTWISCSITSSSPLSISISLTRGGSSRTTRLSTRLSSPAMVP
jgi:hypothetical protein